jgi:hypothetical protein
MDSQADPVRPDTSTVPQSSASAPRYSYYALSVLTLLNFLNYIDRQVLPAVAPAIRETSA